MYKKNQTVGVKIGTRRVNGKNMRVVSLIKRPGVRDMARAAAHSIGRNNANNEPYPDPYADEPWLGGSNTIGPLGDVGGQYADEPWLGGSNTTGGISQSGTKSGGKFWDFLGKGLDKLGGVGNKNDSTAGKQVGNILLGLSETYIADCVRRYKNGDAMSEFDRRVAIAAINVQNKAMDYGKAKLSDWIMEHLPEIGLGVLGVIVLITFISKR